MLAQAAAMLAAGGEVWVGDGTALREFPPLRAGESPRGHPATMLISGRNGRRTLVGALNAVTGEFWHALQPRGRTEAFLAALATFGAVRPKVPKLLIWGNAPSHKPLRVREAALAATIHHRLPPLPLPGVDPVGRPVSRSQSDRGRQPLLPHARGARQRASAWLEAMTGDARRRRCGLHTSKFGWLPT